MSTSQYYVRVYQRDWEQFSDYTARNDLPCVTLSVDIGAGGGSSLYSLQLTTEQASAMKLTFNFLGFMNFNKTLDAHVARRAGVC